MIGQAIKLIEKGLMPDTLIRSGIRQLCKQRLSDEHIDNCELQSKRFNRFLQEIKSSDIAIKTEQANEQHYEVPSQFYQFALGGNLKYSSAYWLENTSSLTDAENLMLELYCRRGQFEDGQNILELGCGWGSLTLYLAAKYPNSNIVALSNSHSQRHHIEEQARQRHLNNITVITCDINQFNPKGLYDRIISIEMFEHIRNYQQLFDNMNHWLNDHGKLFIHIFCHRYLMYPYDEEGDDNWMGRYFFSGGQMPSADTFLHFQNKLQLEKRWILSGQHYEKTSNAWLDNMDKNKKHIMPIFEQTYGKDFAKLWFQRWRIFFMACAELFGYSNGNEWMVAHYLFNKK